MRESCGRTMVGIAVFVLLLTAGCSARAQAVEAGARKGIDTGNQAWIDGMKAGQAAPIAATYAENAVDCGLSGACISGRTAIEKHIERQIATLGRAGGAHVNSVGSVQQGDFVYEWGQAEASFPHGKKVVDRYLTVWHREGGGSWKIFRNMVIPEDGRR